ncbi:SDR family NAD(P)-dependent oxidoreductase [Arcanobacterium phocae]|uniref:SDR family NAD(P)-dependent oxidoreductase n=1 Tax=Arcanobacterium phocae TaxID=131112 RepID=UPI001C0ED3C6|nr:SDR family NAD(P)-dependent oxidoreductase [Arcanobacterium phocae]
MEVATTVLITGASRGIGSYIARGLARSGRTLLLTARTHEALYDTAKACNARGADVVALGADLGAPSDIDRVLSTILNYPVDLLINNAGVMEEEALPWDTDPQVWWNTLEVNLRAPYLLAHALIPPMLSRGGGRIIDLSSGAAVQDSAMASAYYVSKTALLRFAGSLHEAGYSQGLRVFSVAPGVVRTDMTVNRAMHEGRAQWNDPREVVEIITAIADGELDGISGTQVRAGTDSIAELRMRSKLGAGASERKLRLTPWEI